MTRNRFFRKRIWRLFTVTYILILLLTALASNASSAPSVDPETVRFYSYTGDYKVGNWLNTFDDKGRCIGNTYVIFNAGASFNQFGFPIVWAGKKENGADGSFTVSLHEYKESPEESVKSTPVFTETLYQNGDNGYGAIYPIGKAVPAGKYILVCSQITAKTGDASPYIVIPTGTASRGSGYLQFGGTAEGVICFFIDFIRDDSVADYILPLASDGSSYIENDEPVTVLESAGKEARRLGDEETLAVLTKSIPAGKVLSRFEFLSMPTWGNNGPGSDLSYQVYKWNKDYATSVSGQPITSGVIKDHKDNAPLELGFGLALTGGDRYLIVVRTAGTMPIGYWKSNGSMKETKWKVYINGEEISKADMPGFSYTTGTIATLEAAAETPNEASATPAETAPAATPDRVPESTAQNTKDQETEKPKPHSGCGSVANGHQILFLLPAAGIVTVIKRRRLKKRSVFTR